MNLLKSAALLALSSVAVALGQNPQHGLPSQMPHLEKNGQVTQMIVDGRPYLMLAGELHNSSGSSAVYMQPIWGKLAALHLNTVISTASWELIEPTEGRFDFSVVDAQIAAAQEHGLHLVLIWFGTWKNASSSYVPMWVKKDPQRFPLAETKSGGASFMGLKFDALSPFGSATIASDAHALQALMRHLRNSDPKHTVIMVQVENESGLLGDSRDRSPLAQAAWDKPVPAELLDYMVKHKDALLPELTSVWSASGFKTSGTWTQVFGTSAAAEEVFMAWYVAHDINSIAEAGKKELALPMYANAWLGPQPGALIPGQYPSGGPVTGMLDVWRAAAPSLDFFAPDIYIADFQCVCQRQVRSGNPLFIPEARVNIANLFWAVGHHAALGYSPFGIEDLVDDKPLAQAYAFLGGITPLLMKQQAEGKVMTVMEGNEASVKDFEAMTGMTVTFGGMQSLMSPVPKIKNQQKDLPPAPTAEAFSLKPDVDPRGFALVVQTGPNEFFISGSNLLVRNAASRIGTVDEGSFNKGQWIPGRRLNGDETFSGDVVILGKEVIETRRVITY